MAASKNPIVRPPIGSVDWEGLAWLMGIPNHRRELFIDWLQTCIKEEWEHAAIPPEKVALWRRVERINADIARTGRAFIRAVEQRRALSTPSDERKKAELLAKYLKAEMAAEPMKWLSNREIIMAVGNYIKSRTPLNEGRPSIRTDSRSSLSTRSTLPALWVVACLSTERLATAMWSICWSNYVRSCRPV
jgi:hypothetical protein